MTIRVLMVDDHAVVRMGYRTLLETASGIQIVAEADNGEAGFRAFVEHQPSVVIMDLSLPGISGLETIRRIVSRDPAGENSGVQHARGNCVRGAGTSGRGAWLHQQK